jgi:hypothetical protein
MVGQELKEASKALNEAREKVKNAIGERSLG